MSHKIPRFAFPLYSSGTGQVLSHGMTLRDYLAAAAMQGLIANGSMTIIKADVARRAYEFADAMLDERCHEDPTP